MKRWFSWAAVGLLALLCAVVAFLQYRWIGEISTAERQRLQDQLGRELISFRTAFAEEIRNSAAALAVNAVEVERQGREAAYAAHYREWKLSHRPIFQRIALAVPRDGALALELLDLANARFSPAPWPDAWSGLHERLEARLAARGGPFHAGQSGVFEMPRFGAAPRETPGEQDWLILEPSVESMRTGPIPELLERYLGHAGRMDYEAAITSPAGLIFESSPAAWSRIGESADGSVPLWSGPQGPGSRGAPPASPGARTGPFLGGGLDWTLVVRHKAGSLEALVEQARHRNLALSAGLLLLLVATVVALVRFSRQAQRLAELQIHFVAGVSHELRTPLTVIRTAAYNLRGRLAERPEQVERYGQLIESESKKLEALIGQVLQFASAGAGHAIRQREPVQVEELIDKALETSALARRQAGVVLEKEIAEDLPPVLADGLALRHALQNLIDNALKYGAESGKWIGVFAKAVQSGHGSSVEIRVADRGPGIPPDEQEQIFNAFFRGRRAISDQIHGTGLGLDLVKKIVVAHGGSVQVRSAAGRPTEFVLRLPAA